MKSVRTKPGSTIVRCMLNWATSKANDSEKPSTLPDLLTPFEVRNLVDCLELLCGFYERGIGVTFMAHTLAGRLGLLAKLLYHPTGAEGMHRTPFLIYAKGVAGHLCLPAGARAPLASLGRCGGARWDCGCQGLWLSRAAWHMSCQRS
jgi:hypothetical protein